jgi:hypothetical protein
MAMETAGLIPVDIARVHARQATRDPGAISARVLTRDTQHAGKNAREMQTATVRGMRGESNGKMNSAHSSIPAPALAMQAVQAPSVRSVVVVDLRGLPFGQNLLVSQPQLMGVQRQELLTTTGTRRGEVAVVHTLIETAIHGGRLISKRIMRLKKSKLQIGAIAVETA